MFTTSNPSVIRILKSILRGNLVISQILNLFGSFVKKLDFIRFLDEVIDVTVRISSSDPAANSPWVILTTNVDKGDILVDNGSVEDKYVRNIEREVEPPPVRGSDSLIASVTSGHALRDSVFRLLSDGLGNNGILSGVSGVSGFSGGSLSDQVGELIIDLLSGHRIDLLLLDFSLRFFITRRLFHLWSILNFLLEQLESLLIDGSEISGLLTLEDSGSKCEFVASWVNLFINNNLNFARLKDICSCFSRAINAAEEFRLPEWSKVIGNRFLLISESLVPSSTLNSGVFIGQVDNAIPLECL